MSGTKRPARRRIGRPPTTRANAAALLAEMPPVPTDALALPGWYALLVARQTIAYLQGRSTRELGQQIRASSRAAAAAVPKERIWQAEQTILRAERRDTEAHGPRMTDVPESGAPLRGAPGRGRQRQ